MSHIDLYSTDGDDDVVCPYDPSHVVARKRIQYHLMKCRKNHTGPRFVTCPFNATHEMPRSELQYHKMHCPDKCMLETEMTYAASLETGDGAYFSGNTKVPDYVEFKPTSNEDWDDEIANDGKPNETLQRQTYTYANGMDTEWNYVREETNVRRPVSTPQTFKPFKGGNFYNPKLVQPPNVFSYSLSMAGIGRGGQMGTTRQEIPLGLGRSRGKKSSEYMSEKKTTGFINDQSSQNTFGNDVDFKNASNEKQGPNITAYKVVTGRGRGRGQRWQDGKSAMNMSYNEQEIFGDIETEKIPQGDNYKQEDKFSYHTPENAVVTETKTGGSMAKNKFSFTGNENQARKVLKDCNGISTITKRDAPSDKENLSNGYWHNKQSNVCEPLENAKKRSRKLNKKLRQIEELERKKRTGSYLTDEEFNKISMKDKLVQELESLKM